MVIVAKYAGTCTGCGQAIQPGERIEWVKMMTGTMTSHEQCTSKPQTIARRVPARRSYSDRRPTVGRCRCGFPCEEIRHGMTACCLCRRESPSNACQMCDR